MKLETFEQAQRPKVVEAYEQNETFIDQYFDYIHDAQGIEKRLAALGKRNYQRAELQEIIRSFMEPFGISETAEKRIAQITDEQAVMVVGGQQAGVLTGPLYSVHKAITVLLHAKEQEQALGIPVIPLFWVAGEDHDLNEINHVYSETNGQLVKEQLADTFILKEMASDATYTEEHMVQLITSTFEKFGETAYTKALYEEVLAAARQEHTFTNFFVRLMNQLFAQHGLLFIDAAYQPLRRIESRYFTQLIEHNEQVAAVTAKVEAQFEAEGFGRPIGVEETDAHLFYLHETGRVLLGRDGEYFVNESVGLRFTKEELLAIAEKTPEKLSNNVVTRPIMQDFVFPVLSFVGGAGELAYWALLKEAFHTVQLTMPVFVPRMSFTLVSRAVEKVLQEEQLSVVDVMNGQASVRKQQVFEALQDQAFARAVDNLEQVLTAQYAQLDTEFGEGNQALHQVLQQNMKYHRKQIMYLQEKYEDVVYVNHQRQLDKFDLIEAQLFPLMQLQERVYHPYYFMNLYGPTLIDELVALPLKNDGKHQVVYL